MISLGRSSRPRILKENFKTNEKADDVDAWPVARFGRSFRFLRGRCSGADQEEGEEEEVDRHQSPSEELGFFQQDFNAAQFLASGKGLRGVAILSPSLDSPLAVFLISSLM
jgi:hypothetical protein